MNENNSPHIPDWAADAVWYQIFPERFCNGAPQSNPTAEDVGATNRFPGWHIRAWNKEWYARDDWEKTAGNDFRPAVFWRRFGGDLVGVRQKIPYLKDLGINAVYLNPVFWAPSLHKYDAICHHHIDPTLGPDRAGDLALLAAANETSDPATWIWTAADRDFLSLVDAFHANGIRVILDGVFNHSGNQCFAMQDILANGKASPYADWYTLHHWEENGAPEFAFWDGGGRTLPEFARADDNLLPGIRQYILDATRRWMDPENEANGAPVRGIDGWRLDVAYCVPHGFWKEWHTLVRTLRHDAYTTGEIVGPAQDYVRPDEFSAVMNYEWLYPTLSYFTPHPDAIPLATFQQRIETLLARHTFPETLAMQNLLDSHDTGRILTLLESGIPPVENWDPYFHWPKPENPDCRTTAPGAAAKQRFRLMLFWQFTAPGAPMIYAGDELGMWGANDPCCRQAMPWAETHPEPETLDAHGNPVGPHSRAPDTDLHDDIRSFIQMRKDTPELRRGDFRFVDAGKNLLAYTRSLPGEPPLLCLINKTSEPRTYRTHTLPPNTAITTRRF